MSQTIGRQGQTATGQVPGPRVSAETGAEAGAGPAVAAAAAAPVGDPALIGLPTFMVGSIGLALVDVGFVPATAAGAAVPLIMTASAVGSVVAMIWAARLGQSAVAGVYAIFGGFWLSYAALVLGLTHNWFGIPLTGVVRTQEAFLIAWVVIVGLLTLASVRLPIAYTALFALVEAAFVLALVGTIYANTTLTKIGGYCVFAFVAVGAYLYMSSMSAATGGRPFALGRPILR
ncbi:MAG: GPR1/FUN34/YaaH family transporter [Blastococcus sp.]